MRIWAGTHHLGVSMRVPRLGLWRFFGSFMLAAIVFGWPWTLLHGWPRFAVGIPWELVLVPLFFLSALRRRS